MSHLQRSPRIPPQTVPNNQCLTGCLYQVVQSTGHQGSNVLKLLPIVKSKDHPFPVAPSPLTPSASRLHAPPAVPAVSILSGAGPVSVPLLRAPALGNYIVTAQNNLHVENPFPPSQERSLLLDNAQVTLPSNSVPGNPTLLMMNMKQASPVKAATMLPSGHSLQIPAHAEVISVPVSSLPFSIQQKILPQAGGTDGSKIPSVIYVSPVNTVKSNNPSATLYPNTSSVVPATKSPARQGPPPTGSDAPKGPMKWVVQESDACLVPVKSSNDTASKILQMLSKTKMEDVTLTSSNQSKAVQIKENALVMCNNKIFFLTKKGTELIDAGNKNLEPPPPAKPVAPTKPTKDLSNKVVQVVLSKNKSPPPGAEELVQSNVVSTAKPKRKSSTPRAHRGDPGVIYGSDYNEGCSDASVKPRDPPSTRPDPAHNGGAAKKDDQPPPKSQGTEVATAAKAPEVSGMDDRSWRRKFGLLKKEKIVLKRIPLIRAQGSRTDPDDGKMPDPVEMQQQQPKRKSSSRQAAKASKKQKSAEDGNVKQNSGNPGVSTDSPLPVSGRSPDPTDTWSPTHCGGEASDPPDIADFLVDQEIAGHFSDVSLPNQKSHMDSFSSMYSDETTKDEKIQRLKEVLKEREKALEALRRQKKT